MAEVDGVEEVEGSAPESEQAQSGAGALGNLVNQFSSAMDCFRELVQNSVDAGSSVVEISTEFRQAETGGGAIIIRVEDWGEGMDREVIEKQFTRLFASTKRQDLTKIGKFGIGFVSVFALKPRAVIVHTGRSGEYWEVVFGEDRTFQVAPLEHPVEGTQITLMLEGDVRRYEELARDIRGALEQWCRHSEADVGFEDRTPVQGGDPVWERINEAFEVEGRCGVSLARGTQEVALAFSMKPEHEFYNRGLTLATGDRGTTALGQEYGERFGHIAFKVSSPHFGHTLTRETVVRDASFHDGMRVLERVVVEELVPRLAAELEELVQRKEWTVAETASYREALWFLAQETEEAILSIRTRKILRLIDGKTACLDELHEVFRKERRVMVTERPSELLDRLLVQGSLVFWGRATPTAEARGPVESFLRRAILAREGVTIAGRLRSQVQRNRWGRRRICFAPEEVYVPARLDESVPAECAPILQKTQAWMESQGWAYRGILTCRLTSAEQAVPIFLLASQAGEGEVELRRPVAMREPEEWVVAIHRRHPHFLRLVALHERHPALAAAMLARCLRYDEYDEDGPELYDRTSEMAVAGGLR